MGASVVSSYGVASGTSNISFSHTFTSTGSNKLVVAIGMWEYPGTVGFSSATLDGVAADGNFQTLVYDNGNAISIVIPYWLDGNHPGTGSYTVVINPDGTTQRSAYAIFEIEDANQSTPLVGYDSATAADLGDTDTIAATIANYAGELGITLIGISDTSDFPTSLTHPSGTTEVVDDINADIRIGVAYDTSIASASETYTWTFVGGTSSDSTATAAFAVLGAGGGGTVSGYLGVSAALAGSFSANGTTDAYGSFSLATALAVSTAFAGTTEIYGGLTKTAALAAGINFTGWVLPEGNLNLSTALTVTPAITGVTDITGNLNKAVTLTVTPAMQGIVAVGVLGALNLSTALSVTPAMQGDVTAFGAMDRSAQLIVVPELTGWVLPEGSMSLAAALAVAPSIQGQVEHISGALNLSPALAVGISINGDVHAVIDVYGSLNVAAAISGTFDANGATTITGSLNLNTALSVTPTINGLTPTVFGGILMGSRVQGSFSADGFSDGVVSNWGTLLVSAVGNFGGGSVSVQYLAQDGNWKTFDSGVVGTLSANGEILIPSFPPDLNVRLSLSGATNPNVAYILAA